MTVLSEMLASLFLGLAVTVAGRSAFSIEGYGRAIQEGLEEGKFTTNTTLAA